MQHCFGAANLHMPFVLQEHEVLHQELNNQNKALLERVRELVDAGDVKDTRIRELEAQVRSLQGSPFSKSYSGITLYPSAAEKLILCLFTFAGAVPKEEATKLKSNLSELTKRYDALVLQKTEMAEELKQTSDNLKYSDERREELEGTISTLEEDLDDLSKSAETCNKELLRKRTSFPFRYVSCHPMKFHNL